jgi:hypothetical protein
MFVRGEAFKHRQHGDTISEFTGAKKAVGHGIHVMFSPGT